MNTLQKALKRKLDCFLVGLCKDEDLKDKYNMAYIILRGKLTPRFLYTHEKELYELGYSLNKVVKGKVCIITKSGAEYKNCECICYTKDSCDVENAEVTVISGKVYCVDCNVTVFHAKLLCAFNSIVHVEDGVRIITNKCKVYLHYCENLHLQDSKCIAVQVDEVDVDDSFLSIQQANLIEVYGHSNVKAKWQSVVNAYVVTGGTIKLYHESFIRMNKNNKLNVKLYDKSQMMYI